MKKLNTLLDNLLKLCSSPVKLSFYVKIKVARALKVRLFLEAEAAADMKEEDSKGLSDK